MRRWLVGMLLLGCAWASAASAQVAIDLVLDGPEPIAVAAGRVVASPFSVRVLRASDRSPVVGARVGFFVVDPPVGVPPPDYLEYQARLLGRFVGTDSPFATVTALTDAEGRARAPAFLGGSIAGSYEIAATVSAQDAENAGLAQEAGIFGVLQTLTMVSNVDATSMLGLALLACICIAFAWRALRER